MINLRKLFWSIFYFGGAFIIGALIGREIIIYYDAYVFKIWSWKNPPAIINTTISLFKPFIKVGKTNFKIITNTILKIIFKKI